MDISLLVPHVAKSGQVDVKATNKSRRLRLVDRENAPAAEAAPAPVSSEAHGSDVQAQVPAVRASRPQVATIAGLSDAQLVAMGIQADTAALEVLYRRHAAFAINLAARIEGSSRDVEDIAHDAFLRAFEHLSELADPSLFRSWLGSIVVHAVRSRMRRARLMAMLGMGHGTDLVDIDALASPEASPAVRAQIAQIYALLRTVPTDERIAWMLRNVEGHDLETVAHLTRCSLATVKRRISRTQHFLDDSFVDAEQHEVSS